MNPIGALDGCEEFFDNEPYAGNVYGIISVEFKHENLYRPDVIYSNLTNEEKKEITQKRVKSIKRQRCEAIDEFNKEVAKHLKLTNNSYIRDENILILWKNLPSKTKMETLGHSNDYLLSLFCKKISWEKDKDTRIYIDNSKGLKEEGETSFGHMLERINYIWKTTGIIPEFLDNVFFEESELADLNPDEYRKYKKAEKDFEDTTTFYKSMSESEDIKIRSMYNETLAKTAEDMFTNEVLKPIMKSADDRFAIRFFKSIQKLSDVIDGKNKFDTLIEGKEEVFFIPTYYKMQAGDLRYTDAAETFSRDISSPSIYKKSQDFQSSPIYADYMNCWIVDIGDVERTAGTIPDYMEFLLCCAELRAAQEKNTNKLHREVYLRISDMFSPAEFDRIMIRAVHEYKNVKLKKPKELNRKLEEYGVSEADKEYIEKYFIKEKEA